MKKYYERKLYYENSNYILIEKNFIKLNESSNESRFNIVQLSTNLSGRVIIKDGFDFELSLNLERKNGTCNCNNFQRIEFPCIHAYSFISFIRLNILDFVSNYYKLDYYKNIYEVNYPIMTINDLEPSELNPPIKKRGCGRPKKKRVERNSDQI